MERVQIYGIALLVIGAGMRYWVNRRRYNRWIGKAWRPMPYEKALAVNYMERFIKVAGFLIFAFGVVLFVMGLLL